MKIVYIAPCRTVFPSRSASSIHMIRMCEALAELGCTVTLVVSNSGTSKNDILNYYGVTTNFDISFVAIPSHKVGNVFYAFKAAKAALNLNPDYVLGRSASACYLSCLLGGSVVFDSHGPVWLSNWFEAVSFKMMSKHARLLRMTVNSYALKNMYEQHGWSPKCQIVVAHNGSKKIDMSQLRDVKSWPGREGNMQAGYVGHLYPGRGVDVILACAEELFDVDFHIIGGAEEDIVRWQSGCNLGNVYFHGFVKNSIVASYRNKCDVLMAPYQSSGVAVAGGNGDSSSYMNPIKIVEYMASGKAIICSDMPILREVLGSEGAMYVPSADVAAWKNAIIKMKQPLLREEYASRARDIFTEELTWQARAKKMIVQL